METPGLSPSATPLGLQRGAPKTGGKLHRGLVPGEGRRAGEGWWGRGCARRSAPGSVPKSASPHRCSRCLPRIPSTGRSSPATSTPLPTSRGGCPHRGQGLEKGTDLTAGCGAGWEVAPEIPASLNSPPGGCVESCREQGAFQESCPPWRPRGPSHRRCRYIRHVQQETSVYHSPAPPQLPKGSCCHRGACPGMPRTLPRCVQPAASPCQG